MQILHTQWEIRLTFFNLTFLFICVTGFNIKDLINVTPLEGGKLSYSVAQSTNETNLENPKIRLTYFYTLLSGGTMREIKVEEMTGKLRRLQHGSVLNS